MWYTTVSQPFGWRIVRVRRSIDGMRYVIDYEVAE